MQLERIIPHSGMPRMTTNGKSIESPVTDPINRNTTAYKAWFYRKHAAFIAAYEKELETWFSMSDEQRLAISCRMMDAAHAQNPDAFRLSPIPDHDRINALADADVALIETLEQMVDEVLA
jgi:hypothetical protein